MSAILMIDCDANQQDRELALEDLMGLGGK